MIRRALGPTQEEFAARYGILLGTLRAIGNRAPRSGHLCPHPPHGDCARPAGGHRGPAAQRGRARQAGQIASLCHAGAYANRRVVVVDDDTM